MDWNLLIFLTLIGTVCRVSDGATRAVINMNNLKAVIQFEQRGANDVVITATEVSNPPTVDMTVEIVSGLVTYDVQEKCSDGMHSIVRTLSTLWSLQLGTSRTLTNTQLGDLQGRSIRLLAGGKKYCASILDDDVTYQTASAHFSGIASGTVYFRRADRADDADEKTFVTSYLVPDAGVSHLIWFITKDIQSCADKNSFATANVFYNMTDRLGPINDISKAEVTYAGSDLPLSEDSNGILNKYLIVYELGDYTKASCAKILNIQPRKATTMFSHQGIHGHISFSQSSPFDPTETRVDLQGLNSGAKGYHVHLYPVPIQEVKGQSLCSGSIVAGHFNPYGIDSGFPAPTEGTDDEYEVGDLSSKYGTLAGMNDLSVNYTDWNLPLFGKNSIVGRSIVIHRDDNSNSRWVCSNILLDEPVISGVATFNYPIYGKIYFTQSLESPYSDTWIFSSLSYLEDSSSPASTDHRWHINGNKTGDDFLAAGTDRCAWNKDVFDPLDGTVCSPSDPASQCRLGDLSGKLGKIGIGTYPEALSFFTGQFLPLSGDESILGKSVVIAHSSGIDSDILACATIQPLHQPQFKVEMSLGTVTFSQQPGFGQRPTTMTLNLPTFDSGKHKLQVNSLPPTDGQTQCFHVGQVYNPLEVSTTGSSSTHDQFKLGDLSRLGSSDWTDLNLPLTGLTSIRHRTLVALDNQNNVMACGLIQDPFSTTFDGYQVIAKATFSDPLDGYIEMFQTLFKDGSMTDTSVVLHLANKDGSKTADHNWHVHVYPVSDDASAASGRCSSTGPHYDPFNAKIGDALAKYGERCSKTNPLRCELGDQAMKLGTYSLGSGRKLVTDVDLPLNGKYKVQGRSIVVHVQEKGAARYSCADINPVSQLALAVEFKTPQKLDLLEAARLYANAINANEEGVVLELKSKTVDLTKAHVHFLGFSRELNRARFLSYFKKEANRDNFGIYAPLSAPETVKTGENKAGVVAFSSVLLLVTIILNTIVFQV